MYFKLRDIDLEIFKSIFYWKVYVKISESFARYLPEIKNFSVIGGISNDPSTKKRIKLSLLWRSWIFLHDKKRLENFKWKIFQTKALLCPDLIEVLDFDMKWLCKVLEMRRKIFGWMPEWPWENFTMSVRRLFLRNWSAGQWNRSYGTAKINDQITMQKFECLQECAGRQQKSVQTWTSRVSRTQPFSFKWLYSEFFSKFLPRSLTLNKLNKHFFVKNTERHFLYRIIKLYSMIELMLIYSKKNNLIFQN